MRKIKALLSTALLFMGTETVNAQYRVGPIYPEQPQLNQTSMSVYNPFQLNWSRGRFEYAPLGYVPAGGASYDPYRFNSYSGRWDYVPMSTQLSLSPPSPFVGGAVVGGNATPMITQPYGQIDARLQPLGVDSTNDIRVPMQNYWIGPLSTPSAPPTTGPTTAPSMSTSVGPSTRPSAIFGR